MKKKEDCSCQNKGCPRNGNCVECQAFHASNKDYPLTGCQRLEAAKAKEAK